MTYALAPDDPRHGTTTGYRYGCRKDCCRAAVARKRAEERKRYYLQRTTTFMVPATGTLRRIQALAAIGWSLSEVSRQAGYARTHARLIGGRPMIHKSTADRFLKVYDALSMTPAPERTKAEKINASRSRRLARVREWPPPLAWEGLDIDNPDERPTTQPVDRRETVDAMLEDAEWLADSDLSLSAVIERLDVNRNTFRDACRRAGRLDLYWRLANREPDADMRRAVSDGIKRNKEVA